MQKIIISLLESSDLREMQRNSFKEDMYGKQKRIGETTHWLCEKEDYSEPYCIQRGMKLVNELTNIAIHRIILQFLSKVKVKDTQDISHYIVSDSLQTVTGGH